MTEPIIIGVESIKFLPTATTFMKQLFFPTPFSGTLSLHDVTNNTNYQVPVGKKFIMLKVVGGGAEVQNGAQYTQSVNIFRNTIADSTVGGTQVYRRSAAFNYKSTANSTTMGMFDMPISDLTYITFIAGNFVNAQVDYSVGLQVFGVECDA